MKATFTKKQMKELIERLPDDSAALGAVSAALNGSKVPHIPGSKAPKMPDQTHPAEIRGKFNPLWVIEMRDNALKMNQQWFAYYGQQWPGLEKQVDLAHRIAKEHGIDLATYSPETFDLSQINSIDDVFCASEEQIDELIERIRSSTEIGLKSLDAAKKKRWARVLRKVKSARAMCRDPIPQVVPRKIDAPKTDREREVWEATHTLRYMLWVMRSNLLSPTGEMGLLQLPPHLVLTAMVISLARKHRVEYRIHGVLIQIPPGHGKTTVAEADRALWMIQNPALAGANLHHVKDLAADRYHGVRNHFKPGHDYNRRRMALYPNITLDRRHRGEQEMYLLVDGERLCPYQEGNLTFYGVHSAAQGVNINELSIDDPSDEKEVNQPGTRESTNRAMSRTWLARLRGKSSFFVFICTSWHKDDFASRLIKMNQSGEMKIGHLSIACGGPEDGFAPIWPDVYDESRLRAAFRRLGSADYACQYQNDPDSEGRRKLSRIHYYDYSFWDKPESAPEEWQRFWYDKDTLFYISVDPAGTSKRTSDLAGSLVCAFGKMRQKCEETGSIEDVPRVVFTDMASIQASQSKLAKKIKRQIVGLDTRYPNVSSREDGHKVHRVIVESTAGFHATAEFLEQVEEIPKSKIMTVPPGIGTKASKFMQYAAIHVEHGDALFPGEWVTDESGDAVLGCKSGWEDCIDQMLDPHGSADDNMLDCVRQVMKELGPKIQQANQQLAAARYRTPQELSVRNRRGRYFDSKLKRAVPSNQRRRNLGILRKQLA